MSLAQPQVEGDRRVLQSMIDGYRVSQMLYVVAKLHVADILAAGPMMIHEIAAAVGAHPEVKTTATQTYIKVDYGARSLPPSSMRFLLYDSCL